MKHVNKIAIVAIAATMMASNVNAVSSWLNGPFQPSKLQRCWNFVINSSAISHVRNNPVAYGVGVVGASAGAGIFKAVKNRKAKLAAEKATKLAAEKATKLAAEKAANVSLWSKTKEFGAKYLNSGKGIVKNAWAGCTKENGKKAFNATVNFVKDNKVTNHLSANKKAYAIGAGAAAGIGVASYAGYKALKYFGWFNGEKTITNENGEEFANINATDENGNLYTVH